jgi:LPXTG-motif cell wall-anchored protein
LAAALALAVPAGALVGGIDKAVQGLRSSPVYVDPGARNVLSESDARRIAREIDAKNAGPMYIVVLPAAAADAAGGDPVSVLREIQKQLGRPGVYAGIIGNHFRAGATAGILPKGETAKLADAAFKQHQPDRAAAVLMDFVDRVAAARNGRGSGSGGSSGAGSLVVLGLIVLGGGAFVLVRRRNKRRELDEVKHVARDDLIALGDEIRALDVDASMPSASAEGKQHYNQAVDIYQSAEQGLDRVRRTEDLRPISGELERGRYEMQAAQALFEGNEPPVRQAPCFFDPRHGPSVRTVEWAPPGGTPRPVPACAMDAERVEQGLDPEVRELDYGGRRIPYWAAPRAYTPFFGGFWGGFGGGFGGFFPGLLIGEMLGGGWGANWDGPGGDGQGDGGDFGGGGGDFGGGDFGGGDF